MATHQTREALALQRPGYTPLTLVPMGTALALAATGIVWGVAAAWVVRLRRLGAPLRGPLGRSVGGWRVAIGLPAASLGVLVFSGIALSAALAGNPEMLHDFAWEILGASLATLGLRYRSRRIHVRAGGVASFPFVWPWRRIDALRRPQTESILEIRGGSRFLLERRTVRLEIAESQVDAVDEIVEAVSDRLGDPARPQIDAARGPASGAAPDSA